ncbi:hypothetical protein M2G96_00145 [Vibrio vulnificus]|nr:hypothetical protein [Vibrio vulnificus]
MSELKDALAEAGVFTLEYVNNNPDALARFCDAQNALFNEYVKTNPKRQPRSTYSGFSLKAILRHWLNLFLTRKVVWP